MTTFATRPLAWAPWFALLGAAVVLLFRGGTGAVLFGAVLGLLVFASSFTLARLSDGVAPSFTACLRREIHALFATPIPWFVLFLFTAMSGALFYIGFATPLQGAEGLVSLRGVLASLASMGFLLFPLLTMGLFAQERSEGTIEVLLTAPVSAIAVTMAKYLAVLAFYGVMLVPSLVFYALLDRIGQPIGKPDLGIALTSYLGILLSGGFYLAIGLFCSSLTGSQVLAALLTWVFILFFRLAPGLGVLPGLADGTSGEVLRFLDPLGAHLLPFLRGVVAPEDVMFFLSLTAFFLFLAARAVMARSWR